MIITVGTGETVSHGICFSIRQQNPDYIIFVVTKESKEKTLPLILQDPIMKTKVFDEFTLTDEIDVEEIHLECDKIIDSLVKKQYEPRDVVIDYTSGTKAMSAGVVLRALNRRLGSLVYVSGKRDKNGRVISGAEKTISIEPNRIYAESLFTEAVNLFNSCQFDGCLKIINQVKDLVAELEFQNKLRLLEKLAHIYSLWDKFNLNETFNLLDELSNNELLADWGIKSRLEKNKKVLYKEKNNLFCLERVVDLLENARRRGDLEKKFDDAVARLYRCLEYIAQIKIAQRKLYQEDEKGNPDSEALDVEKLPPQLREKYSSKDSKDNKVKLGLYRDYELLFDLNDELGLLFKKEYENNNLKRLLSLRNNSILAHKFNPISEGAYKEIITEVEKFINSAFPEADSLIEEVNFPRIKTLGNYPDKG